MDVIVDTNLLLSDVYLTSPDFDVLFAYLQTTDSRLLIPQVALEEAPASYRRSAEKALRELEKKQADLRRLGISVPPLPDLNTECLRYEAHLKSLITEPEVAVVPYSPDYLKEVMHRAINRLRPCSDTGEEFRDAVLWLSVVDQLRSSSGKEIAFITDDGIFLNKDRTGLHAALRKEADSTGAVLHHYAKLSDFLASRTSVVTAIDLAWVLARLPAEQVRSRVQAFLWANALEDLEDYCGRKLDLGNYEMSLVGFSGSRLFDPENVKVYELKGGRLEVHTTFLLELEIEAEVTEFLEVGRGRYTRLERSSPTRTEHFMPLVRVRIVSDLDGDKLINGKVVEWEFA